jgi:hypothetical protein
MNGRGNLLLGVAVAAGVAFVAPLTVMLCLMGSLAIVAPLVYLAATAGKPRPARRWRLTLLTFDMHQDGFDGVPSEPPMRVIPSEPRRGITRRAS